MAYSERARTLAPAIGATASLLGASLMAALLLDGLAVITAAPASAATIAAPHCNVSWKDAAGGLWSKGANWSTGAPPTATQAACITRALTGPVVLSGAGAARSLTLGGPGGTAELELNGATLTLGAGSTVAPTGALVAIGAGSTVQERHGAVLSNRGDVTVLAEGLQVEGSFTNSPIGTVNVDETGGWQTPGSAGTLTVGTSSSFTNEGMVWVQPYGSIKAPSGPSAVIDNAAGTIFTAGNIAVGTGAAFVEGSGRVIGSVIGNYNRVIVDGGMLDLAGSGTSTFQLQGAARLEGTIAPGQVVATFSSPYLATVGSVTNEGLITTQYANATLTVPAGSTLVNSGIIQAVHGNSLGLAGNVVNSASGSLDVADGTVSLVGRAELVNRGAVSVTGSGSLDVPQGTVFHNAGGTIYNQGTFQVDSGTFIEGAGTVSGIPVHLQDTGALDLAGDGASAFELLGGSIQGNIARDQSVDVGGDVTAPAHFTNYGDLSVKAANLTLAPGGTLTNQGELVSPASTQEFNLYGDLVNAPGAVFNMNGAGGYSGNLYLQRPGATFVNEGTFEMGTAFLDLAALHQTFKNTGTWLVGVNGGGWGSFGLPSGTQATAGYAHIVIDGVVEPLFTDGSSPAELSPPSPPWPTTAKTIVYGFLGGGGGVVNLTCGAQVTGRWYLTCTNPHRPPSQGGDSARAILNVNSATTLDPTAAALTSSEPVAGYGRAFTSHYGQPVTLTATVRQEHGPQPGGEVIFYDSMNNVLGYTLGTAVLGTADLSNVDGVATAKLTTNALGVGLHDIVAFFAGDAHSLASISKDYTQQIAPDATVVRLVAPAASAFGRAATLRAVVLPSLVGPAAPTGDIVFYGQGGSQYLAAVPVTTVRGTAGAVLRTTGLSPATQNLVAIYLGDGSYAESTSPTVNYRGLAPPSLSPTGR
jgi:Bacterial Ig-like domain (group 3)